MKNIIDNFTNLDIFSINWRAFLIGFIYVFLMVTLQFLGLKKPDFLNFNLNKSTIISPKIPQIIKSDVISPKLELKQNSFNLKNKTSFVNRAYASNDFNNHEAFLVIDFDSGEIILNKNSNERVPVASLTKIMTAIVALDLAHPQEKFEVSINASNIVPTKIGVVPGQKMTLNELLYASLLTSANDATEVIKEGIDKKYGKGTFINAMNVKANFLKLNNTNFSNPQGFDSINNYSTPEDLAVLSHYALNNYPLIMEIVKKDYVYIPQNSDHKQFDLYNWNGLINVYPNTMGVKIGYTDDAGYTNVVISEREGKKVLVVVVGEKTTLDRDMFAAQLLDYGFSNKFNLPPVLIKEVHLLTKYATWKYY